MKYLFLQNRLFIILIGIILIFIFAFFHPILFTIGQITLASLMLLVFIDTFLLYRLKEGIKASRNTNEKLSNGDVNDVYIHIASFYTFNITLVIIDEAPIQFQLRQLNFKTNLSSGSKKTIHYQLRPTQRGEYTFNAINVFVSSILGLVSRRYKFDAKQNVPVYPSFIEMQKYELLAISNRLNEIGVKRIRQIGNSMEFEQIKEYVLGDDIRTINWKATARKAQLMVNHYQNERSQQVYSVIDKGRSMKMPFENMTLMDYAINSSLIVSSVAIRKHDRAGIINLSHKVDSALQASRHSGQMKKILEHLYKQKTNFEETNFERLCIYLNNKVRHRSLLMLYTNFESLNSMNRQLEYFKLIARKHLLVLIFFENTALSSLLKETPNDIEGIYAQTIAEKSNYEKQLIVKELQQSGIFAILTTPKNLNVSVINKYLELKARNLI